MFKTFKAEREKLALHYKKELSAKEKPTKITVCKRCHSFFYEKSWHFEMPMNKEEYGDVKFSKCLPCIEEENAFFQEQAGFAY